MPRNSSGNYTLPAGNPVVPNTLIETAWANPTMSDIGSAITDSLDRSGRGAMLAPLLLVAGSEAAPALAFTSESTSGFWRVGANIIGLALAGVERMRWTTAGPTVIGTLSVVGAISSTSSLSGTSLNLTTTLTVGQTATFNGNTVIGNASSDTLTIAPNTVTWSNDPTHSGNHTFSGNVTVNGGTTVGNAAGDALTINSSAVSIPNGLNFDSNTLVIDAANNKVLLGTQTPRNFLNTGYTPPLQVEGTTGTTSGISAISNVNAAAGSASLLFGKTRGAAVGGTTIIQNGDTLGLIAFAGSDGTNLVEACRLTAEVNGTPGASDMPGRFSIHLTSDGATGVSERVRFTQTEVLPITSISLGSASNQWSDVRSVLGTFTGQISSSVSGAALLQSSATSGSSNSVQVFNTSNTVASDSILLLSVGGASAGDAYTRYNINGVRNWATGVDNSAGDIFVISAGQEPGTNNVFQADGSSGNIIFPSGAVSLVGGNLDVTRSASGASVISTAANTSNTAASDAVVQIRTAGSSGGDPFIAFEIAGGTNWVLGTDNSDSDAFVGSVGTVIGTNNWIRVATDGSVTFPDAQGVVFSGGAVSVTGGNFNTVRAGAGVTVISSVVNTSNTASSDARLQAEVAGSSAGDAVIVWNIGGGGQVWAAGLDNSDGDAFVLAASAALGTTNALRISTALAADFLGSLSVSGGDLTTSRSAAGGSVINNITNNSTAASSDALLALSANSGTAGDPYIRFTVAGVTNFAVGLDNSAGDAFCISPTTTPGNGTAGAYITTAGTMTNEASSSVSTVPIFQVLNHHASAASGAEIRYSAASPNNTTTFFLRCTDGTPTLRAEFRSNGGLANFSANNVNLSDARVKRDIKPAGSYWDKFKALELVHFLYTDQSDDVHSLGVIAQQVAEVAPELVDTSGYGPDGLLAVYQTDFQFATAKALQEAMARIEHLEARLASMH